jgi:hypothetical protein
MLDYDGRPPSVSISVDPDDFNYSSVYLLCQDLSVMLDNSWIQRMNEATNPDSVLYLNPRDLTDTIAIQLYGYSNDSLIVIYNIKPGPR